ncbi:MAG: hypothetical protein SVW57_08265 [Thermodesulfobacteriota bacterium]|nr:hypothetical protein [Thermodesulfobacteriota bacterium]
MIEGLANINMNMDKYLGHQKDISKQRDDNIGLAGKVEEIQKEGTLISQSVKEVPASEEFRNDTTKDTKKEIENFEDSKTNTPQQTGIGILIDKLI